MMNLIKYAIIGILVLLPSISYAQPDILWSRLYGGDSPDAFYHMQETSDSGFIMTGPTESFGAESSDYWVVKTNSLGDTLWTYQFRGSSIDVAYGIRELSDSGFALLGTSRSFGGFDADVYLIKLDRNGAPLWSRVYGGDFSDYGYSLIELEDKSLIITGKTISFSNEWLLYLIRIDSSGDTLWTKTYGGDISEEGGVKIKQTSDDNFIIIGFAESFGAGLEDYWLVKINQDGDTLWTRTYGGTKSDVGLDLVQTPDSGFILVGYTESYGNGKDDVWIIRTDSIGDTLWTKTYGGTLRDGAQSITVAQNGGYLITGYHGLSDAGTLQKWLIRINEDGDSLWTKVLRSYGGALRAAEQTPDGSYAVAGWIKFESSGDIHGYLAKIIVRPYTLISADSIWFDSDIDGYAEGTLDATSSWHAEGTTIVEYEWSWNDQVIGTDSIIKYSLPVGHHTLTLTTTDAREISSSKEVDITVYSFKEALPGPVSSSITSSGDSLFFGFDNNRVHRWKKNGEMLPSIDVDGVIQNAITVGDNSNFYIPTRDSGLFAFDIDGNLLYRVPIGRIYEVSPALSRDGTLYIGNTSGDFYSIKADDGTINWSVNLGVPHIVSPAVNNESVVYLNGPDRDLLAINPDGSILWSFQTGAWISSSPAVDFDDNVYFGNDNNQLFKISSAGNEIWQVVLTDMIHSSPVVSHDGMVYVKTIDGNVHCISSSGELLWSFDTKITAFRSPFDSPVILSDGRIAVYNSAGEFILLNPDGNIDWLFDTGGAIKTPPIVTSDGVVHLISSGTILYGLALPDYTPGEIAPWHTFQRNNQRTGVQSSLVSVKDDETKVLPTEYSLKQNYTNPFNSVTTIEFSLPKQSHVLLIIYNLNGQEVERVVDAVQPAGSYTSQFDATRLSSGIYIYKLQADRYSKTLKMVLLK